MKYIRKTRDEYAVQGYYGPEYGWEDVCTEDTRKEARERLKEYRENETQYPHRMIKRRVRLEPTALARGLAAGTAIA